MKYEENKLSKFQIHGNDGRNLAPRIVTTIANVPCIPISYEATYNSEIESNNIVLEYQMDLLDISTIYKEATLDNNTIVIEIWLGYLDSTFQTSWTQSLLDAEFKDNDSLKNNLLDTYKDKLTRRYVGILKAFSFNYNADGLDTITITVGDIISLIQQITFEGVFKDDGSSVENVIKAMNARLKNYEIVLDGVDPSIKSLKLGYEKRIKRDKENGDETEEQKEIKYDTRDKTIFDILNDICKKGNLTYTVDSTNYGSKGKLKYILTPRYSSDTTWTLEREKHFENCSLRSAKVGSGFINKIAVEVRSPNTEDNEVAYNIGTFPENLSKAENVEGTRFFIYQTQPNKEKKELDLMAKDIALRYAKFDLNGTVPLKHALIGIEPNHNLRLIDNTTYLGIRSLKSLLDPLDNKENAVNFIIKTVTESMNFNQFTQSIEFELNPNLNILDISTGQMFGRNLLPKKDREQNVFDNFGNVFNNIDQQGQSFLNNLRNYLLDNANYKKLN